MFKPKLGQLVIYTHPYLNAGQSYYAIVTDIQDDDIVQISFCNQEWVLYVSIKFLELASDVDE